MARKGKTRDRKASGRSVSKRRKSPESREKKEVQARRRDLKRRLRKETNPLERRYLERQIRSLDWDLQQLRARHRIP